MGRALCDPLVARLARFRIKLRNTYFCEGLPGAGPFWSGFAGAIPT